MTPANEQRLTAKYPMLFCDLNGPVRATGMAFGCQCGDGWLDILDRYCSDVMTLCRLVDAQAYLLLVKEKYATLRISAGLRLPPETPPDVSTLVSRCLWLLADDAENESHHVCETCGERGELRQRFGWLRTLCEQHWEEWQHEA